MFLNDAAVLDGHRPAGKIHHASAIVDVPIMQSGFVECFRNQRELDRHAQRLKQVAE
jgi:hypothetical protein